MFEWMFWKLKEFAPIILFLGIVLHLINLKNVEKWAVRHICFALFGLAAPILLSFSLAETLLGFKIFFAILSVYFILNWNEFGLNIAIAGSLLNFLVIILNDGYMPMAFTPFDVEEGIYRFINDKTVLPILSDIIWVGSYRASIGDFLLRIGPILFLFSQLKILIEKISD